MTTSITDLQELAFKAFAEDFAFNDITSMGCIDPDLQARAHFVLKQDGCIAGLAFMPLVFQLRDPSLKVELFGSDGSSYPAGTILGKVEGSAQSLLSAERVALNLLQHLSGIATLTAKCVSLAAHTKCKILDTRKTVPGFRNLQKYAVRMGGGTNHRMHLADRILIKNNHLALAGSIATTIENARAKFPDQPIQIEVSSLDELKEALQFRPNAILLDNMTPREIKECVSLVKGEVFLEASGGIRLSNLKEYAETGVDAISMGALTHSAPALDISLRASHL